MSNVMIRIPKYKLQVSVLVGETLKTLYFYLKNLNDIKKFLEKTDISGTSSSQLYEQIVVQNDARSLLASTRQVNTQLDNIKYVYYRLEISTQNMMNWFDFTSLYEVKKFIRRFSSSTGSTQAGIYTVHKNTKYFDKDDNYKLKQVSETLGNNIW